TRAARRNSVDWVESQWRSCLVPRQPTSPLDDLLRGGAHGGSQVSSRRPGNGAKGRGLFFTRGGAGGSALEPILRSPGSRVTPHGFRRTRSPPTRLALSTSNGRTSSCAARSSSGRRIVVGSGRP